MKNLIPYILIFILKFQKFNLFFLVSEKGNFDGNDLSLSAFGYNLILINTLNCLFSHIFRNSGYKKFNISNFIDFQINVKIFKNTQLLKEFSNFSNSR